MDVRNLNNNSGTLSGADLGAPGHYGQPTSALSPPKPPARANDWDPAMPGDMMDLARRPVSPKYERQNHGVRIQSAHLRA